MFQLKILNAWAIAYCSYMGSLHCLLCYSVLVTIPIQNSTALHCYISTVGQPTRFVELSNSSGVENNFLTVNVEAVRIWDNLHCAKYNINVVHNLSWYSYTRPYSLFFFFGLVMQKQKGSKKNAVTCKSIEKEKTTIWIRTVFHYKPRFILQSGL